MYQSIKDAIQTVIDQYEANNPINDDIKGIKNHYFLEGMRVSLQLIEQVEEINKEELAYETFEESVRFLSDNLDRYDMDVIIEDVFMDKNDEEDN